MAEQNQRGQELYTVLYAQQYAMMTEEEARNTQFQKLAEKNCDSLMDKAKWLDENPKRDTMMDKLNPFEWTGANDAKREAYTNGINEGSVHMLQNTNEYAKYMQGIIDDAFATDPVKREQATEAHKLEMAAAVAKEYETIYTLDQKYGLLTEETKQQLDSVSVEGVDMTYSEYVDSKEAMMDQMTGKTTESELNRNDEVLPSAADLDAEETMDEDLMVDPEVTAPTDSHVPNLENGTSRKEAEPVTTKKTNRYEQAMGRLGGIGQAVEAEAAKEMEV